tara:strand:+ start:291 stop:1787 length:1497 start_codon:yes stop_codon:yes gene_type:complete
MLDNLIIGFEFALSWQHLIWCFIGVFFGTAIGVLPGIGPIATISILLPFTYSLGDPGGSIIMMAGIYYGAQYGGSTTAILVNLPGEVGSLVTTLDGYQMAKKGRAGPALAISALGSFFAGTISIFFIAGLASPLSELALKFGPTEYTSLMIFGIASAVILSQNGYLKGLGMALVGILFSTVGTDVHTGEVRFTFGSIYLLDGFSFAIMVIGMFGMSEIIYNIIHLTDDQKKSISKIGKIWPTNKDFKKAIPACLRGTIIGSLMGILPGVGSVFSAITSYVVEKKISKTPEQFGKGAIEGVAGPESANNAGAQTSFIPMLTLGIPVTPVMAIMMATLMIHDIQPGPQFILKNPELFWGLIASFWVGNLFLLFLNLPLIGIWVKLLKISWRILYPLIICFCIVGSYFINYSWSDVFFILIPFSILGYLFKICDCNPAPLLMGFVVGGMMEEYLRRALIFSNGDWMIFFQKPISLSLFLIGVILILILNFKYFFIKFDKDK